MLCLPLSPSLDVGLESGGAERFLLLEGFRSRVSFLKTRAPSCPSCAPSRELSASTWQVVNKNVLHGWGEGERRGGGRRG